MTGVSRHLLQVEALEAGYDDVQVLWGISLEVKRRQHDHAGRRQRRRQDHQLARDHRQHPPFARRRVLFRGEDVTRLPAHAKAERGLVLVPEGRQLFSDMSVEENLEMGAFSKRARRASPSSSSQVYTLFPRLKERRRQKAGTFSGGEQQMLAIGRGLMSDPEILIIDELSLGLAPVVVQQLAGQAQGAEGRRAHHPAGRAERASCAGAQRLRLCHRRRPSLRRRPERRGRGHAGNPAGLSRALIHPLTPPAAALR